MRKFQLWGMLLLSAAFLFSSCAKKQDDGKVAFIDREVDVKSFLTGFPYSTWGFYLSDDATKLYYLRNDEPSPLVMLDLTKSTDISQGDIISSDDWSKKNFWNPSWNEKDGFLYWMGDQRNDEKIDLYRMDPKTGETTCFTDVPYIYGWSFNDAKDKAFYVARIDQVGDDHVDEFHILDLKTLEDKTVCTDRPDFRMTWTEIASSPDDSGCLLTVLKNVNRTYTNIAYLDYATGEYKVITDPSVEASLDGCAVISPWYSQDVAYFLSDHTGYANVYSFNRATGEVRPVTAYRQDLRAKWLEADGKKYLATVRTSPEGSDVAVLDPDGNEIVCERYPATLTLKTTVGNKMYFTAGATDILFQMWAVEFVDGQLKQSVLVDLPENIKSSMVTSHAQKLSIPTFDIDPATGETRMLHAYLMVPENPLPADQARLMVMSFYGGDNAYDMEHQIFTAAGMYVLSASPRGSSGFGRDFGRQRDHRHDLLRPLCLRDAGHPAGACRLLRHEPRRLRDDAADDLPGRGERLQGLLPVRVRRGRGRLLRHHLGALPLQHPGLGLPGGRRPGDREGQADGSFADQPRGQDLRSAPAHPRRPRRPRGHRWFADAVRRVEEGREAGRVPDHEGPGTRLQGHRQPDALLPDHPGFHRPELT